MNILPNKKLSLIHTILITSESLPFHTSRLESTQFEYKLDSVSIKREKNNCGCEYDGIWFYTNPNAKLVCFREKLMCQRKSCQSFKSITILVQK